MAEYVLMMWRLAANYCCKGFHLRYFREFWLRLCCPLVTSVDFTDEGIGIEYYKCKGST